KEGRIFSVTEQTEILRVTNVTNRVSLHCSPDGQSLVCHRANEPNSVLEFYSLTNQELLARYEAKRFHVPMRSRFVPEHRILPDNRYLLTSQETESREYVLYDLRTGKPVKRIMSDADPTAFAVSGGRFLAVADNLKRLRVYDLSDGTVKARF